jgi:hypothetical protein
VVKLDSSGSLVNAPKGNQVLRILLTIGLWDVARCLGHPLIRRTAAPVLKISPSAAKDDELPLLLVPNLTCDMVGGPEGRQLADL